jgi:NAD(P)-dependent dehydrogenase (short-subunit alcohol dehydrogenase family)
MNPTEGAALSGQRIAVTGATRGIGLALVTAFAEAGARVLVHGRSAAKASAIAASLGERHAAIAGDLTDPGLAPRLAAAAHRAFGGLDVLVLNAGVLGPMQPLAETDFDAFTEVMRVNVDAQARLFVACLPDLLAARGKVLWMSSGLGRFGLPRFGAYCASKHALEGLMKVAAAEHGEAGLISVAIAPGMVRTEMLKAAMLGGDVSDKTSPEAAGRAFVRFIKALGPSHNGASLDIAPWLEPA